MPKRGARPPGQDAREVHLYIMYEYYVYEYSFNYCNVVN